jgi:superfamily II DNA or RNA helicase
VFKRLFGKSKQAPAFTWRQEDDDIIVVLEQFGTQLPFADWAAARPDAFASISALLDASNNYGDVAAPPVVVNDDYVRISPELLANMDTATSTALGLPFPTPLALDLRAQNRIDEDDFRLSVRWVRPGGQPIRFRMKGALLHTEAGARRVPEPLWSLYHAAEPLTRPLEKSDRFEALAKLRELWPDDPQLPIESESYLQDLRVHYASSLSVKLNTLTPDRTEFDPVLFSARALADAGDQPIDEDQDSILAPSAQKIFASDRFRREYEARPVYVLRNGEYLFIDPSLRPALNVVRQLQDAPEDQRRAFVLNPRKVLWDAIGDEAAEQIGLEQLFIETEQFSARVSGVDVWRAPVLPWIVPSEKNKWIPEKFGLRVGEEYYALPAKNVAEVSERVREALELNRYEADVRGLLEAAEENGPPPPDKIPVTEQCRVALESLAPFSQDTAPDPESVEPEPTGWDAATQGKLFLVVRDNFEEVEFAPLGLTETSDEKPLPTVSPPDLLKTSLKPHQVEGLNWLAQNALVGRPGALLADDMGLGKTLQAIAFMAWLQSEASEGHRPRAPFLIVAPTGLLGTWRAEIEKHLDEPQLGHLVPAFGGNLKLLRDEDTLRARDIETGKASLDAANWRDAGVVLTTYETLRDYHFSFARTRFGLIVYDEIQKLKNPGSQMTRAAKALNGEFTLGMTGTPVENRLQDLWSIMDVVAPGFLGASRDFEKRHPADDAEALARLKSQLTDPIKGRPPYMLRRLKADALEGMPAKHLHALEMQMPPVQAIAYRDLVVRAAAASTAGTLGKGGMLSTLANMRGVSLHPRDPREAADDLDAYARDSARLSQTLTVLQRVAQAKEKALIFVEDLVMQERLAGLIQQRFALPARPMRINGTVPGHKRQGIVEAFQSRPGSFDVMILSPRAGGVGLTLTAANHVIHLSRWWNPAVEDQATDRVFRIGQSRDVHVYLPMAVHPDPDLAPSSFDLRLNALIERKRKLTRDLFFPPDANDGELGELFREVSLDQEIKPDQEPAIPATSADQPAKDGTGTSLSEALASHEPVDGVDQNLAGEDATSAAPRGTQDRGDRLKLSLPKAVTDAQIKMWRSAPGQPRPTGEILSLFAGRHITQVTIRDPYALVTHEARRSQIEFLRELKQAASTLESVLIEYAPEAEGDRDEVVCRREFGSGFTTAFAGSPPKLLLSRRSKRSRDDDFHDRFVEIDVRHAGGAIKRHELTIGRGIEALYNNRRQCTVTYAPPGSV